MPSEGDTIRQDVRAALPENVLALMDEIERLANQQITFAFNDRPPPDNYQEAAACVLLEDGARILIRAGAPIIPQDILHELLHIQRYWIEGIPQLEPTEALAHLEGNWDVTGRIENILEHLVIVPREAAYGFGPREAWVKGALSELSQYPWPILADPFSRRLGWITAWLNCPLTCDPAVAKLAEQCLLAEGVLDEAKRIQAAVAKRLSNKGRCLLTVTKAVGIAPREVRLAYLDIKAKRKTYASLPAV